MRISYLLDTSAFRSLSGEVLQNLSKQDYLLFVSPYCFWEILCHLNERFDYFKVQLMKFKHVKVLDDPLALLYSPFLSEDFTFQERISDDDIIYATLAALRDSDSLDTLYSAYIEDSRGNIRQISDCAKRVSKILEEYEKNYIIFIKKIINIFQSAQLELKTDTSCHQYILSLIEGEVNKLKQKGALDIELIEKVIANTYIYYSYIFHRALRYFRSGTSNIEQNDYEDSMVCLHLKLQTPYCLVTADKGMRDALNKTISFLSRLNNPLFSSTPQVKDVQEVKSHVIIKNQENNELIIR